MIYERAFMEGELDTFDYSLAEALHMTVDQLRRTMPNSEYVAWRALSVYREAMRDMK